VVSVSDTGEGISSEDLPHIFDRFYRGDKSRSRKTGGSGLGLAIAREIVRAHGGEISATSAPGDGATFFVTIPLGAGDRDSTDAIQISM
jgi:signal transduction histidine kinase